MKETMEDGRVTGMKEGSGGDIGRKREGGIWRKGEGGIWRKGVGGDRRGGGATAHWATLAPAGSRAR